MEPSGGGGGGSKKRRRNDDSLAQAYDGITFTPIASSGRPGTPHRYFRESYTVNFAGDNKDANNIENAVEPTQIVHVHVNGLVIVTAGNRFCSESTTDDIMIESIDLQVKVADVASQSAATKRKQKAKMLKGKTVDDSVNPRRVLGKVQLRQNMNNDEKTVVVDLRCCVWGSVIELNSNLSPQLLREDPLLDGYLAVILPSGPFPPPLCVVNGAALPIVVKQDSEASKEEQVSENKG